MSTISPQMPKSATSIYSGIVAAVTTIAVSIILFRKLWETGNKYRDKGILKQGHPNTSQPQESFIDQEVPSIILSRGSSNFRISETNVVIIRNDGGNFTKIQRNLACDYITNPPDINCNLKKDILTKSAMVLPRAETLINDYKKSGPCFRGTRVALLREMADCVTGSSESRVYVLSGQAGIGKSTVAYTIASRAADLNLLGASFVFSRDKANSNNAKRFFTTIAYQLRDFNEAFSKAIGGVLETASESVATTQNLQLQLKLFILDPLWSIVQSRSRPILIVADALDECDEEDAISVLTGLGQLVRVLPPFRVILTTRPKPYFDRFWGSQDSHKFFHVQDMEDKVVNGDIRLYLNHCLSLDQIQMRFPKWQWCATDEEINSLVCAAGRFFIIAATTVRYILDKTVSNPVAQMERLLRASANLQDPSPFKDLDRVYTAILRDVVPEVCDDHDIVSRYQSVVGTIIFIQHPLPVSTLSHLVDIGAEEIRMVLNKLQSVILLGDEDVPRYHKSFPEYLTDWARCKNPHLRIDPRIRHTQIATRCFRILDEHLKYNILGLGDPARFMSNEDGLEEDGITDEHLEEKIPQQLRYACIYWVNHLEAANTEDADLLDALEMFLSKHMLHWLEVLSLIGKFDWAHRAIGIALQLLVQFAFTQMHRVEANEVIQKLSSDLHQLLTDALHFVEQFYEIIKRSALHTYYSALPFTPTNSLLYRRYIKEAEHSICSIDGGPEKWDPLVTTLSHGEPNVIKFSLDSALFISYSVKCSYENEKCIFRPQGKLKIWDATTGTPIATIPGDTFAVANDFSTIASSQHNIAMLHNVNGSPTSTMITTSSEIRKLALSSESSRVAAALDDGTVWLWDSRSAECIDKSDGFEGIQGKALWSRLEFSPTGTRLAYSSANGITLRDGISGRFIADLQSRSKHKFEFSADGSRIACLSACRLTLWESDSGMLIGDVDDAGYGLAISGNGSLIATADGLKVTLRSGNNGCLSPIKVLEFSHTVHTRSMVFSLDDILAIATHFDTNVQLYSVKTHSFISTIQLSRMPIKLAFSPDRARLAVGSEDGNVSLWDIDASNLLPREKPTAVTALTLSQGCSRLAYGFKNGTVELWDTSPVKWQIASHQAHGSSVLVLGFGPDGGLFASGSDDGTINLWNSEDGSLRGTLNTRYGLRSMGLSNSVLVAAGNHDVTLWSLDTLALIHTFTESNYETSTVSIAENDVLVAVARRGDVSLFDAVKLRAITTFDVFSDEIHTMTFLPDNLQLVAHSKDGFLLSINLINKHVMKGTIPEHLIQLPNISLWHGVPIWHCLDNEQHCFKALFSQDKSPVPVLWIPRHIPVTAWTQGSSMIVLGCQDGRVILLRLPTSNVG